MKILFENWRKHLNEGEEIPARKIYEEWGEWTIGELDDLIIQARKAEKQMDYDIPSKLKAFLKLGGVEMAKHAAETVGKEFGIAGLGAGSTVIGFFVDKTREVNVKRKAGVTDTLEDFPILDKLDIDPLYVVWLEDDKLNDIDEAYQKYLGRMDSTTQLKNVKNINEFIRTWIDKETGQRLRVWLQDE